MSRLCRLYSKSHGDDGKWAANEIKSLRAQLAEAQAEIEHLKISRENFAAHSESTLGQLAASQAREVRLREALNVAADKFHDYAEIHSMKERTRDNIEKIERNLELARLCDTALSQPTDTTALEAMIQKAGEVMRERCIAAAEVSKYGDTMNLGTGLITSGCAYSIRALPSVRLEDLK